jgi:hypothetical protein
VPGRRAGATGTRPSDGNEWESVAERAGSPSRDGCTHDVFGVHKCVRGTIRLERSRSAFAQGMHRWRKERGAGLQSACWRRELYEELELSLRRLAVPIAAEGWPTDKICARRRQESASDGNAIDGAAQCVRVRRLQLNALLNTKPSDELGGKEIGV